MTGTTSSPHHYHQELSAAARAAGTTALVNTMTPSYFANISTPYQPPPTTAKSPSPNYFGFRADDSSALLRDSPHHAKQNWSPPSSAIRSTAAASPSLLPVDQNPEFDAFRRQSEGKAFNLGGLGGNFKMNTPPPTGAGRPKATRTASKTSGSKDSTRVVEKSRGNATPGPTRTRSKEMLDPSSAELSRSPKRVLSPGSAAQWEPTRKGSPAHFGGEAERTQSQPRFQLPLDNPSGPLGSQPPKRAETVPKSSPSEAEQMMVTPQHVVTLLDSKMEDVLLLDLRVSTQYAQAHIAGALNLCIPTTLLKRPSFNVQKLAETFRDDEQRRKFEHWRNSSYIIVYDTSSSQMKDAQICLSMVRKFQNEGYDGALHIIKGGFAEFKNAFASYTEAGLDSQKNEEGGADVILPVAGGCAMPTTDKPANPFFGNIRQNMDLIGGVGQIALKHPASSISGRAREEKYPQWLRSAADDRDQGRIVSKKFEAIERREKKRMEEALSGQVSYGSTTSPKTPRPPQQNGRPNGVQIAGIEKGNKNRYNNIWPFEHSRVRLQGVPKTGCDYFNANYVKAAWSNKRYISTQAPIPATFNDFWNVVWQQDVRVIVMLTAEKEGAQVKAHNYWDKKQYGPLRLEFLSEKRASLEPSRIHNSQRKQHQQSQQHQQTQSRPTSAKRSSTQSSNPQVPLATIESREFSTDVLTSTSSPNGQTPYVIVRKFTLSHEKYPFAPWREITQLQYSSWPDFGAPAHPAHLLGLVEQTDAVVRATNKVRGSKEPEPKAQRPILVHCSAGCGRTGTFCTVDSVIDMLKRQKLDEKKRKRRESRSKAVRNEKPSAREKLTPVASARTPRTPAASARPGGGKTPSAQTLSAQSPGDFFTSKPAFSGTQPNPKPPTSESKGAEDTDTSVTDSTTDTDADATSEETDDSESSDSELHGSWLRDQHIDLVEKTVEDFRHQRLSMVQSLRQFVLCYESVMEWIAEQSPSTSEGEVGEVMEGDGREGDEDEEEESEEDKEM